MERHADGELPPAGKPKAVPVCERREPAGRGAAPRVLIKQRCFPPVPAYDTGEVYVFHSHKERKEVL